MADKKTMQAIIELQGKVDPSLDKNFQAAKKKISGFNKAIIAGAAAAAAALAGVGGALLNIANNFDDAVDTIRTGTGATGDALAALEKDFEAVYKSVPTSTEAAATAIADLNTRLDLSGDTLQAVAKRAIQLSDTLGAGDLSAVIEESAGALQRFNVEQNDMAAAMDHAFKVAQSTGISYSELTKYLTDNGAVLQALGYDYNNAASLLGKLKKEGANTQKVMAGLQKAVAFASSNGLDAADTFAQYYDQIKNATSETEALTAGVEIFGSKGAAEMVNAIRNGTLEIEDFNAAIEANSETIGTAAGDTYDYAEKLAVMKQNLELALKPVANSVFDAINAAMPQIEKILERVTPLFERLGEIIPPIIDGIVSGLESIVKGLFFVLDNWEAFIPILSGVAAALATIKAIQFASTLIGIIGTMKTAITAAGSLNAVLMANPLGLIAGAIGLVVAAGVALWRNWDTVKAAAVALWEKISGVWESIKTSISTAMSAISSGLTSAWDGIKGAVSGAASFIKDTLSGAFTALVGIIKAPINTIIGMINGIISKINGVGFTIPDWVPVIGGQGFALNIPEIPMLATGGFTNGVSIAGEAGQEAVISFDSAVRAENIGYWTKAGQILGALNSSGQTTTGGTRYEIGSFTFSPVVNCNDNARAGDIAAAIKKLGPEFTDMILDALQGQKAGVY